MSHLSTVPTFRRTFHN